MEKIAFIPLPLAIGAGLLSAAGAGAVGYKKGTRSGAVRTADAMSREYSKQRALENESIAQNFSLMNEQENSIIARKAFEQGIEAAMAKQSNLQKTAAKIVLEPKTIDAVNNAVLDAIHYAKTGQARPRVQHHYNTMIPAKNRPEIEMPASGGGSSGVGKFLVPAGIGVGGGLLGLHLMKKKQEADQYKYASLEKTLEEKPRQNRFMSEERKNDIFDQLNINKYKATAVEKKLQHEKALQDLKDLRESALLRSQRTKAEALAGLSGNIEKIVNTPFNIAKNIMSAIKEKRSLSTPHGSPMTVRNLLIPAAIGGAAVLMPSLYFNRNRD